LYALRLSRDDVTEKGAKITLVAGIFVMSAQIISLDEARDNSMIPRCSQPVGRFQHEAILSGILLLYRVSSRWKSTPKFPPSL
jgi:hypothetical protein